MGTTSSIVGVYTLAGKIGRHCWRSGRENADGGDDIKDSLTTSLKAYERKFQPLIKQLQKGISGDSGYNAILSATFGIAILNCLLGVASLFRANIRKYFLQEYDKIGRG
jgi:hypothetical protein